MLSGLLGRKIGMARIVDANGQPQAATVIALGPCVVTQLKTVASDGYDAVQVGFERAKPSHVTRARRGHAAKAEVAVPVVMKEFQRRAEGELKLGKAVSVADVFQPGDTVNVSGISKGHGYSGVIKRHHFAGFPGGHGTHEYFRHGGSIGNRSFPGRVRKGLRMAGQMGNERVTTLNLKVMEVLAEDNAIVVSGAVPGAAGGIVTVKHAVRPL